MFLLTVTCQRTVEYWYTSDALMQCDLSPVVIVNVHRSQFVTPAGVGLGQGGPSGHEPSLLHLIMARLKEEVLAILLKMVRNISLRYLKLLSKRKSASVF